MAPSKSPRGKVLCSALRFYRPSLQVLEDRTLLSFITAPSYPAGNNPQSVVAADFNRDGIPDLAVADGALSGTVSILLGKGDGSFFAAKSYAVGSIPRSLAVGDLNGDGIADLVTANSFADTVSILVGNGDGTFQPAKNYAAGSHPQSVAVGDFNGDGALDLAVGGSNLGVGAVNILLGQGDGTFQPARELRVPHAVSSVAVADFNRDNIPDLVAANDNLLSVLLGKGDGSFQSAKNYSINASSRMVAVADFDGDGKLDLIVAHNVVGIFLYESLSVLPGKGDGTFQTAQTYEAGPGLVSFAARDLNGDGILDLALAYASGTVGIFLGNSQTAFPDLQI